MKNQPIFFLYKKKSIENSLGNNRKVGFSWQQNTLKWEMRREPNEVVVVVSLSLQHRKQF